MRAQRTIARRLLDRLRLEVANVRPDVWLVQAVSDALPTDAFARLRATLLRLTGARVGAGTVIGGRVRVTGGRRPHARLAIGERCFVNDGAHFDAAAPITIGDAVYLGHQVTVITSTHEIGDASCRARDVIAQPVTIGDGSWIGARATLLPGVTIGRGVIVAAGAVVTGPVEDDQLVGGVPARVIRTLPEGAPDRARSPHES